MVFSGEDDKFILEAYFRSGQRDENGWTYSVQSCFLQFLEEFPNHEEVDYEIFAQHVRRLVARFRNTGSICKGKSPGRKTVLSEDTLEDVRERLAVSPTKPLRQLAAQTGKYPLMRHILIIKQTIFLGLSYGSVHRAVRKLHLHPYKISVVQELLPLDFEKRVNYCQWFNNNLNNDDLLDKTFFTDEAWFHLTGYVNSQNYRTWSAENPHVLRESSLHPIKVGVWVAVSRRRIIGPIFFDNTINAERYRTNILEPFLEELHDDELQEGYFQQDGATAHTAAATLRFLQEFYGDRIISRNLYPPRSPDLTPLDFYLFGSLKNSVYVNRLHTLEDLKNAISDKIRHITENELHDVFNNLKRRVHLCLLHEGRHFEHFM